MGEEYWQGSLRGACEYSCLLKIHALINRTQPQGVVMPALSAALTEPMKSKALERALAFQDPKLHGKESMKKRIKARSSMHGRAKLDGHVEQHLSPLLQNRKRALLKSDEKKGEEKWWMDGWMAGWVDGWMKFPAMRSQSGQWISISPRLLGPPSTSRGFAAHSRLSASRGCYCYHHPHHLHSTNALLPPATPPAASSDRRAGEKFR